MVIISELYCYIQKSVHSPQCKYTKIFHKYIFFNIGIAALGLAVLWMALKVVRGRIQTFS